MRNKLKTPNGINIHIYIDFQSIILEKRQFLRQIQIVQYHQINIHFFKIHLYKKLFMYLNVDQKLQVNVEL